MAEGVTGLGQDEMVARIRAYAFPQHVKVVCDAHRPMKYGKVAFVECPRPECQGILAARRDEVRRAGAPTDEEKARWRAQRRGDAMAKVTPPGGKA